MREIIETCDKCGHRESTLDPNDVKARHIGFDEIQVCVGYTSYSFQPNRPDSEIAAKWCKECLRKAGFVWNDNKAPVVQAETASEQITRLIQEIAGEAGAEAAIQAIQSR